MLQQILQPVPLFLLFIIAIYTLILLFLLSKKKPKGKTAETPTVSPIKQARVKSDQQKFESAAEQAMLLNQTFRKFVPKQFVDHLAKHGSESLELGRADEDELAILFSDIRGFTGLSEHMSPQELMNFLNSYFLRMNDPIHQNNGFIDKFIGDAVMALFDRPTGSNVDKAQDAIRAALDLRYAINLYNQHRANSNYPPINVGIGIHFGPVIIGTVGSNDRMDTTVIGDSVNVAFRLEALAPIYDADIVVSEQILTQANAKQHFSYRLLDWVRVKGRNTPIEVYEILDHQAEDLKKAKLASTDLIEQGIDFRKQRNWQQAEDCFQQVLTFLPNDKVAIHHIQQCKTLQDTALPSDWDGSILMRP
ncbi:adenylate/guanylate cyclase domain-containing protein [Paraglaciecola sp. L3A3]|uniref:adenylate/guanylate cyclase domain-containing protein n=1 Tax=Paraglaciecola sp. L3A3 TaxID=2686358 RepID=UPI00131AB170|nr:adenylate/guanylate cyclase domain-containing protein [Paraglaciecola sp. L3A3]